MTYYLRGELSNSSFFMVGVDLENTSYLYSGDGVLVPGNSSIGFYHTDNFPARQPVYFHMAGQNLSLGAFHFMQNPDGSLGLTGGDNVSLRLKNVDYNGLGVQAGAFYNLINQNNEPVTFPIVTVNNKIETISKVRFVPKTFYSSGGCALVDDSLASELLWIKDPVNFSTKGFTTLTDCQNKSFYSYCLLNETCGKNNCNGPCPGLGQCVLKNDFYTCSTSGPNNKTTSKNKIVTVRWHIGLSTVIIIVILFILFLSVAHG